MFEQTAQRLPATETQPKRPLKKQYGVISSQPARLELQAIGEQLAQMRAKDEAMMTRRIAEQVPQVWQS